MAVAIDDKNQAVDCRSCGYKGRREEFEDEEAIWGGGTDDDLVAYDMTYNCPECGEMGYNNLIYQQWEREE